MAYYLSKKNKQILELLIPRLRETVNELRIDSQTPKDIEYILRNAGNLPEYSWIKDKFTLRVREGYVLCKLRNIDFSISSEGDNSDREKREIESISSGGVGNGRVLNSSFPEIFNILFNQKPDLIQFKDNLKKEEKDKLEKYCTNNNYKMEIEENVITFTKIKNE